MTDSAVTLEPHWSHTYHRSHTGFTPMTANFHAAYTQAEQIHIVNIDQQINSKDRSILSPDHETIVLG